MDTLLSPIWLVLAIPLLAAFELAENAYGVKPARCSKELKRGLARSGP